MRAPGVARLSLDEIETKVNDESREVFARLSGGSGARTISVKAFQGYIRAQVGVEQHPSDGGGQAARVAPRAAPAPAPAAWSAWSTHWSDEHAGLYWSNSATMATTWDVPSELAPWRTHVDATTGGVYYINTATNETSWDTPAGWGEGKARPPPLSGEPGEAQGEAQGETTGSVAASYGNDAVHDGLRESGGGWTAHWSARDGMYYYVNDVTQETSWARSAEMPPLT